MSSNFIGRKCLSTHFRVFISSCSSFHTLFSRSFSSPASNFIPNSSNENSFTVNFLTDSCGFPPELALSASKYLNLKSPDKTASVISLFKKHGFANTQILDIVKRCPRLLSSDPEKTLLPKLEYFNSIGLSGTRLVRLITKAPHLLHCSLDNRIIPTIKFFQNMCQSDEKAISLVERFPMMFVNNIQLNLVPNIKILQQVGVSHSHILSFATYQTRALFSNTEKFRRLVEEVEGMGFDPLKVNFVLAIHAVGSMRKSNWEKKVELYKRWGWSEDDVYRAFRKRPWCMVISGDKITRVMDFLINQMGMKSSNLVHDPRILSLSLEKRTVPRCLFYRVLLDRGLIKKENEPNFTKWLTIPENDFIRRIMKISKEEAPQLLKLYQAKLISAE